MNQKTQVFFIGTFVSADTLHYKTLVTNESMN